MGIHVRRRSTFVVMALLTASFVACRPDNPSETEGTSPSAETEGTSPSAQHGGTSPSAETEGTSPSTETEGTTPSTEPASLFDRWCTVSSHDLSVSPEPSDWLLQSERVTCVRFWGDGIDIPLSQLNPFALTGPPVSPFALVTCGDNTIGIAGGMAPLSL